MLKINTLAPDFSLPDQQNTIRTLSDYAGRWLVLYFYPKDDTPGCTKEACALSEVYDEFQELNVAVVGVSKDSPTSHTNFAKKYHLPFTLLSDESTNMIQNYDAYQEKTVAGKNTISTQRVTYLINPKGEIAKVYPKVDPATHALDIIKDLKNLVT